MSWLLDNSGTTEMVCAEPQDLEDDNDDDGGSDKFRYPSHAASSQPECKSHDSFGDSQVEDLGKPIQFFLNPRHSSMVKDEEVKNNIYAQRVAKHAPELEEEALEFQEPFYKDTEIPVSLSEDEDHSWTCHLPVNQRSRVLRNTSVAPCGYYDCFQCSADKHFEMDAFGPWVHASDPYLGYPGCTEGAELHMLCEEAIGDRDFPSLYLTYDKLREENAMLRRVVRSLQRSLESQVCMVQKLERQLKTSQAKEERDAQELQSFVQRMEWSLQLMTQRALEAESSVEKLKQEIFILQGELESTKVENENLRAGQRTNLGAAKNNINFALQNLHKLIVGADQSIRQLISGAESLHFVAEVLQSTGKIYEVEAEKEL